MFFGVRAKGKGQDEDIEKMLRELYNETLKISPERARQIEHQKAHRIQAMKAGTGPIKVR